MAAQDKKRRRQSGGEQQRGGQTGTAQRGPKPPAASAPSPAAKEAPANQFNFATSLIALLLLACIPYLPALQAGFVWDDQNSVLHNAALHGMWGLRTIWLSVGQIPYEAHWWPLTYTILWLESAAWGVHPFGFHCVNILLHACVAVQIWRLARRMKLPGAWLGAALFAVHPVHVEAAAWIIEIKGLLAAIFYLLAVECFLNCEARRRRFWLVLATLAAGAAMLCKSSPVTLPVGLAILIWRRDGRIDRRAIIALIPIAVATFSMGLLDGWIAQHNPIEAATQSPGALIRMLKAPWAFWQYGEKLAWPFRLSVIYPQWALPVAEPRAWLGLIALFAVATTLWIWRGRFGRGPLACLALYFVTLAPTLGFVHFSFLNVTPIADRYQYLASAAPLCGFAALIAPRLMQLRQRGSLWAGVPVATALLMLACLAWSRAELFRSDTSLFAAAVQVVPNSAQAQMNLGTGLTIDGHPDRAIAPLKRAIELRPNLQPAIARLGVAYALIKQYDEAEKRFALAAKLNPADLHAQQNLAATLILRNAWTEAQTVLEEAARQYPSDSDTAGRLVLVLQRLGNDRRAIEICRGLLDAGSGDNNLQSMLAWLLATSPDPTLRKPAEALSLARLAVQRDSPGEIAAHLNILAAAQSANGQRQEALASARRAVELESADTEPNAAENMKNMQSVLAACEQGRAYVRTPVLKTEGGAQ